MKICFGYDYWCVWDRSMVYLGRVLCKNCLLWKLYEKGGKRSRNQSFDECQLWTVASWKQNNLWGSTSSILLMYI